MKKMRLLVKLKRFRHKFFDVVDLNIP